MFTKDLKIEYLPISELKDYKRKLRISKKQVEKTIGMIEKCDFIPPVIVDINNFIIVGAHFVEAARIKNISEIPIIKADKLTEEQVRVLRVGYDRIAEEADWDKKLLAEEFEEMKIMFPDLDFTVTGFELDEIDLIFDVGLDLSPDGEIPEVQQGASVAKLGDVWCLNNHKLYCGDSLQEDSYHELMGDEKADMVFTDAPYNVKIEGHVGNSGRVKHKEFLMASGEMSVEEFTEFLTTAHKNIAKYSRDGAIVYSFIDWRHIYEISTAAKNASLDQINLCVWVKDNAGMGSLYRSQHELVFVFKKGKAKHVNNVELGKNGRYRTNVWNYAGVNSFGGNRMEELKMHPTVKPVDMVADAMKDCSKRGGIILDPFAGSGTTLIAAEKTERIARLIELSPNYCDVIIKRWQELTGKDAIHKETGKSFDQIVEEVLRDE